MEHSTTFYPDRLGRITATPSEEQAPVSTPISEAASPAPLGVLKIALGVFLGNLAFGIVAALVYGIVTGELARW